MSSQTKPGANNRKQAVLFASKLGLHSELSIDGISPKQKPGHGDPFLAASNSMSGSYIGSGVGVSLGVPVCSGNNAACCRGTPSGGNFSGCLCSHLCQIATMIFWRTPTTGIARTPQSIRRVLRLQSARKWPRLASPPIPVKEPTGCIVPLAYRFRSPEESRAEKGVAVAGRSDPGPNTQTNRASRKGYEEFLPVSPTGCATRYGRVKL